KRHSPPRERDRRGNDQQRYGDDPTPPPVGADWSRSRRTGDRTGSFKFAVGHSISRADRIVHGGIKAMFQSYCNQVRRGLSAIRREWPLKEAAESATEVQAGCPGAFS
ncbi:MAG: hypothetical protein KJ749_02615, partial [Planctomycetes bacterium]|nr:hypothetical protein [Planctomycetota bacterium]